ncbi:hypothetical protein V5O48_015319 [Marasmius crinis-equi]|uniref:Uncharacterized protein n=1 Tax=Marasmius crinis-equi TaxID=585013 RepID=A0ABR3EUW3_9AGAR
MRSNNEESVRLAKYAADILDTLSRNIRNGGANVELSEDMRRDIEAFERTLFRVRDHLEKLQLEKRWKRVARFVFAKETKEQLASLRTELDRAQLVFLPKEIEAQLSAMAMNSTVQDPSHLKLAESACFYIVALRKQNPSHTIEQKGYEAFYNVVVDVVKHFELQTTENPTTWNRSAKKAHKLRVAELKKTLKREYKRASQAEPFKLEDTLVIVGNIVKTIGEAPGLAPLKVAGSLLGQVGDLVKTIHSNKAECTSTLNHAASILGNLTRKMQYSSREPTEDMKDDIRAFEHTLVHVRNHVIKLQQEKGWRHVARFAFAHKAKEELASLRKELERAQLTFVPSNPVKTEMQSGPAKIVVTVHSAFFFF